MKKLAPTNAGRQAAEMRMIRMMCERRFVMKFQTAC